MQAERITSLSVMSLVVALATVGPAGCSVVPSEPSQQASVQQPPLQQAPPQQQAKSLSERRASTGSPSVSARIVSIPESDCEIRRWYNYQVVALPVINQRWIEDGHSLEVRAQRAFDIRHRARINARYMMEGGAEELRQRDMAKYGNPDGPTFSYLIDKSVAKGMTRQQAWKSIIETSSRTDNSYNARCMDQVVNQN